MWLFYRDKTIFVVALWWRLLQEKNEECYQLLPISRLPTWVRSTLHKPPELSTVKLFLKLSIVRLFLKSLAFWWQWSLAIHSLWQFRSSLPLTPQSQSLWQHNSSLPCTRSSRRSRRGHAAADRRSPPSGGWSVACPRRPADGQRCVPACLGRKEHSGWS